jgi:hypothetical protein
MKKGFLFFLALLIYLPVFSCNCDGLSYEEAVARADEIFVGRLIETKEVLTDSYDDGQKYTRLWYALFEVETKWKGSNKKYVKVYQPSTSCDFEFRYLGIRYLVYANHGELFWHGDPRSFEGLNTWLCSRTMEERYFSGANITMDDVPRLNRSFPDSIRLIDNRIINTTNIILVVLILVSIFGFFYLRNRKKVNLGM